MIGRWVQALRPIRPENGPDSYRIWTRAHDEIVQEAELLRQTASRSQAAEAREAFERDAAADLTGVQARAVDLAGRLDGPVTDAAVLLIDLSGSMRHGNHLLAWLLAQGFMTLCHHRGVPYEVLGFTTVGWKGAPVRGGWVWRGRPPNPGRLCATRHIVMRDMEATAPGAKLDILFARWLMRENIDGEALAWVAQRARARGHDDTSVFVASDGAPVDDATLLANEPDFLERHLLWMTNWIAEQEDIRLSGIGLAHEVGRYYPEVATIHAFADVPDALTAIAANLRRQSDRIPEDPVTG